MNISIKEETLGQRIRAQRIRLGMTQEELAERLYMKKSTISYYETDKKEMRASCLAEIARALYTTPDYLLGFEEKQIFFRFGRLTCEILDQPNKDDFVRKYIRKEINITLTSFRTIPGRVFERVL